MKINLNCQSSLYSLVYVRCMYLCISRIKYKYLFYVFCLGAIRKNSLTAKATDAEIEKEVKEWLKFAAERDGGRKQREARRLPPPLV